MNRPTLALGLAPAVTLAALAVADLLAPPTAADPALLPPLLAGLLGALAIPTAEDGDDDRRLMTDGGGPSLREGESRDDSHADVVAQQLAEADPETRAEIEDGGQPIDWYCPDCGEHHRTHTGAAPSMDCLTCRSETDWQREPPTTDPVRADGGDVRCEHCDIVCPDGGNALQGNGYGTERVIEEAPVSKGDILCRDCSQHLFLSGELPDEIQGGLGTFAEGSNQ